MKFIVLSFIAWKVWVFVFLLFAVYFVPQRLDFLGGGAEHYVRYPWFWAWGNFDGEHYLAIAQHGYGNGEQAFFPLYPLLMRFLVWPFRGDLYFLQASGLIISNIVFLIGLVGLWKLIKLDFKNNVAQLSIILLLVFPISFYFGSVYTESLFFALTVWSFYFARQNRWFLAGVLGGFATATRFIGILLLPALFTEWKVSNKKSVKSLLALALIPVGLLGYMYYLRENTGDALAFFHTFTFFGEQRSTDLIVLPQVFWRYIKILFDFPRTDPMFFTIIMEFTTAVLFFVASIISFFKLRKSYAVYLTLGYIIPTLTGSFSSLPRYIVVLFPAFMLFAIFLEKKSIFVKTVMIIISLLLLGTSISMFVRGYWIA